MRNNLIKRVGCHATKRSPQGEPFMPVEDSLSVIGGICQVSIDDNNSHLGKLEVSSNTSILIDCNNSTNKHVHYILIQNTSESEVSVSISSSYGDNGYYTLSEIVKIQSGEAFELSYLFEFGICSILNSGTLKYTSLQSLQS